jgi:hypothetical protein
MTNPDTSAEAVAKVLDGVTDGPWLEEFADVYNSAGEVVALIDGEYLADARFIAAARELVPALSRDLEAMRAERDAAIARAEQAETRVAELEAERAEIGKASVALLDELVAYLSQNAPAHKEALAGLKTARATLSQEGVE